MNVNNIEVGTKRKCAGILDKSNKHTSAYKHAHIHTSNMSPKVLNRDDVTKSIFFPLLGSVHSEEFDLNDYVLFDYDPGHDINKCLPVFEHLLEATPSPPDPGPYGDLSYYDIYSGKIIPINRSLPFEDGTVLPSIIPDI